MSARPIWLRGGLLLVAGCAGAALLLAATSFFLRRAQDSSTMRLPSRPVLAWTVETLPEPADLRAVWTDARGEAFAVGARGAIVRRTPSGTWSKEISATLEDLHAITAGSQSARLFAVGNRGTVVACARDSGVWSVEATPTQENLYAVAACPGGFCAVGARGTVLRRSDDTGKWTRTDAGTSVDLHGIAGWVSAPATPSSAPSIGTFVVGDQGTIVVQRVPFGRSQPALAAWTKEDSHTSEDLRAASFLGYRVIVVGGQGTVLRRDVSTEEPWTKLPAPAREALRDVRLVGASEGKVLVASESNVYEQRFPEMDGWRTSLTARGVWGIDADDPRVVAVGDRGLVHVAALPAASDE
ncbi:MAG: hypothetical protein JWM74_1908 [Myxococcaceae bacterium]|nr:hypothetical protein [Myxococcaceae bacterium]